MDYLHVAVRVASRKYLAGTRMAGKPMLMMRDMGYNPKALVYDATEQLTESGMKWPEPEQKVNEAIIRAWEKAGLSHDPDLDSRMKDDPRFVIHELEHLILDPDFSLGGGGSSSKHSKVESSMEEAFSWGLAGDIEEEAVNIVVAGAYEFLGLTKDMNVKDLLDKLGQAPIENPDRKNIRDSVVYSLRKKFHAFAGELIGKPIGPKLAKELDFHDKLGFSQAVLDGFFRGVAGKYDDYKQVLTAEREEAWRKFNLHLTNEIKKIAPKAEPLFPIQKMKKNQE